MKILGVNTARQQTTVRPTRRQSRKQKFERIRSIFVSVTARSGKESLVRRGEGFILTPKVQKSSDKSQVLQHDTCAGRKTAEYEYIELTC